MLHVNAPQDLDSLPYTHPAYPLVQDLIDRMLTVNVHP